MTKTLLTGALVAPLPAPSTPCHMRPAADRFEAVMAIDIGPQANQFTWTGPTQMAPRWALPKRTPCTSQVHPEPSELIWAQVVVVPHGYCT